MDLKKITSHRFFSQTWIKTVVSGLLIVLAFPPFDIWPLIWVGLSVWLVALAESKTTRQALIQGFLLSQVLTFGGFYWISHSLIQFAMLPPVVAWFAVFLFGLFNQIQVIVGSVAFRWVLHSRQTWFSKSIFIAAFYVSAEAMLPKLFTDTLGHALHSSLWMRQAADLSGLSGLTFLIVFTSACLAHAWIMRRKTIRLTFNLAWGPLIVGSLVPILVAAYGVVQSQSMGALIQSATRHTKIAVIQANIGDFDKVAAESGIGQAADKILEAYLDLSDKALQADPEIEAVVWPETAYAGVFGSPANNIEYDRDRKIIRWSEDHGLPIIFGSYDTQNGKDFNSVFFQGPNLKATYHKHILLPLGEFIPGYESIQWLRKTFPQVGNFGRGPGPEVFHVPMKTKSPLKISPLICYEALFPWFSKRSSELGAELLLNVTNDSWFGPHGEPFLHFALVSFRSIETRLPQLRSTNTGITALVLQDGTVVDPTSLFTPLYQIYRVPIIAPIMTGYLMFGDWVSWLCLALVPMFLFWTRIKSKPRAMPL